MNENEKNLLEETIEECNDMTGMKEAETPEICVSPDENEMKLFWEVTSSLREAV